MMTLGFKGLITVARALWKSVVIDVTQNDDDDDT